MNLIRSLSFLMLMFVAGTAAATEINVSDGQGAPGDPVVMTISLANSAGSPSIAGQLDYPASATTNLVVSSLQPGVVTCSVLMPGLIQFQVGSPARPNELRAAPAADGPACQLSFTITPATTPADYPLFWSNTSCAIDPVCDANGAFLTVLGPDFTSTPSPGGSPIPINATVGGAPGTGVVDTSNTGTTDLTILPSGLSAPLSVSPGTQQTLIPSGGDERTLFTISCDTADGGFFSQTLNLATNDPDEASLNYTVNCTVAGPEADISPASGNIVFNLDTAEPGTDSISINNSGTMPLTITPSAVSAPFTADGPITVMPGGQGGTAFNVGCNSPVPGNFSTPLTLTTNDANESTFTYTLVCNVGPQDIDPTPPAGTPYNLSTPPGVTVTAPLLLANRGGSFLYPLFSGLSGPLSIAPSGKISIPPGEERAFTISCDSPIPGTFSQVLNVNSNDPDEPDITFPVNCNVGGPEFDPTPAAGTTISLAANVGENAASSISISNPGSGSLTVDASGLSGDLSISPPQQVIAAGGSATFNIDCAPSATVTTSQVLTFASNDTDEPSATYPVQCTGLDPGPRALTAISGSGQTASPNAQGGPLVAQLTQGGLPLAGQTVEWTLLNGSDVNIAQPVTSTDSTGRAQTGISFGPNPTAATIEARDSQGNTATFSILATPTTGTSVFLQITDGDNQTGAVGSNSDRPIIFETRNGEGPVSGVQLQFSVSSGTATIPVTAASTDANGQFALTFRFGDVAGPIRIKSVVAGTIEAVEARATAFAPTIAPASGGGQTGLPGTRLPQPLVVSIAAPAAGADLSKGLAGTTVTWTVVAGGGTVTPTSNQTDANGRASAQLTLGPAAGVNQVRASIAGAGSVTFTATATSGGTIAFEQLSGNNQILTGNETSQPLVVRARDGSTPIANARVRWVVPQGVTASATETTTGGDGESSITVVLQSEDGETVFAELIDFPGTASLPFVLSRGIANAAEGTPEEEVGEALDNGCPALEAASAAGEVLSNEERDLLARCREIAAATGDAPNAVDNALNELLADEVEAQNTAIITTQAAQFGNLKARLAALRSGQNNSFGGLALNTPTGPLPLSFLPSTLLQDDAAEGGTSDEAGAQFARWGFFATGTIGSGDRDQTESNAGFDFSNYSITAGIDYRVNDSLILGAALGFGNNDTDLKDDGGGLDTQSLNISGYATYYKGDSFYLDGVFTFGRNDFDIARRIDYTLPAVGGGLTQVDQLATANSEGDQTSFAISFGKDFVRGAWMMGPYMRATYTKIDFDGYVEEVSDPGAPGSGLALVVDDRELLSKELVLGGKLTYTMSTSWGILMPNFALEYLHELEDDPDSLITRFIADPTGTPIVIESENLDRSYFNIGLGLSAIFANGKSAFIYYEHRAGQSEMSMDNLAIGVRIEF